MSSEVKRAVDIGKYLEMMLERCGRTVGDLSRGTDISRSTLDSIIQRGSTELSGVHLVKIARFFGTTAENICISCGLVPGSERAEKTAEFIDKFAGLDSLGIREVLRCLDAQRERMRRARTEYDMPSGAVSPSTCDVTSSETDMFVTQSFRQKIADPGLDPKEFTMGELIFVDPKLEPEDGQACLYEWNGSGWLFRASPTGPVPCNPRYPARRILEEGEFLGTVVGTAKPGSFDVIR